MDRDVSVLVVGAGPTGLLLGAELVRRGVSCHIVDAHREPLHWDRATVVHARSVEIFESLGIHERLLATGARQRMARVFADGRTLGQFDLDRCGSRYHFNVGLSEEVTESILAEYLGRLGGQVMRGVELLDLRDEGNV